MSWRHYRADLDIVIVGPDGELASMALAWFDDRNSTPVGNHPAHRQKGLANAVVSASNASP